MRSLSREMGEATFQPGAGVSDRPRLTSRSFPSYSYVPGLGPHPVTHPAGHMHGIKTTQPSPLDPKRWRESPDFLYAIDLFNHGYYWEAHETWEGLWHVAGRKGAIADFLKGLIKLAAAGVKAREGNPRGVVRHARRAEELITMVRATHGTPTFCGIRLTYLIDAAKELQCEQIGLACEPMTNFIFPIVILPSE